MSTTMREPVLLASNLLALLPSTWSAQADQPGLVFTGPDCEHLVVRVFPRHPVPRSVPQPDMRSVGTEKPVAFTVGQLASMRSLGWNGIQRTRQICAEYEAQYEGRLVVGVDGRNEHMLLFVGTTTIVRVAPAHSPEWLLLTLVHCHESATLQLLADHAASVTSRPGGLLN